MMTPQKLESELASFRGGEILYYRSTPTLLYIPGIRILRINKLWFLFKNHNFI